jgi:plasmid replication initiation protein
MRSNEMSLQELRLFSVYLSRINKDNPDTKVVHFHVSELHSLFDIGEKVNRSYYQKIALGMLDKKIIIQDQDKKGGFLAFQLFSVVSFGGKNKLNEYLKAMGKLREASEQVGKLMPSVKDKLYERITKIPDNMADDELYFTIVAHELALPFLFEYQNNYFNYKLWNALNLGSKNQLRMYEILKQYATIGQRDITVEELKAQLGIEDISYPNFKDFKKFVLEPCRKAINELTDISFAYEPHKRGAKGKILELRFIITSKKNFKDPLSLDKFIDLEDDAAANDSGELDGQLSLLDVFDETEEDELSPYDERIDFLKGACNDEFSKKEIVVLYNLMVEKLSFNYKDGNRYYDYLKRKYDYMKMRNEKETVKNRFGYMQSIIGKDD